MISPIFGTAPPGPDDDGERTSFRRLQVMDLSGIPAFALDEDERATAARKQFQAIVDNYPHTHTADMARYFIGVNAANENDTATAERNLKAVASSGNRELASVAKLALASLYASTNHTKDAVALYQELINKPTASVSKVAAELQLAELYQSLSQPADAKRVAAAGRD